MQTYIIHIHINIKKRQTCVSVPCEKFDLNIYAQFVVELEVSRE